MLGLTFVNPADYDKVRQDDYVSTQIDWVRSGSALNKIREEMGAA